MFGSEVLGIVISLVFIYLLYSLLATIIQEIIATQFGFRAKILEKGIIRMLDDDYKDANMPSAVDRLKGFIDIFKRKRYQPPVTKDFYNHPLIKFLGEDKWHSKPAYLSPQIFSKVLIDILRGKDASPDTDNAQKIEQALNSGKISWGESTFHEDTTDYLKSLWTDAKGDVEKFKTMLETWYNETMDRVSGWYKQHTQVILFFVGLIIAITFNIDTIKIVEKLEKDPKLREQFVAEANAFVQAHPNLDNELEQQKIFNRQQVTGIGNDSARKVKTLDSIALVQYKQLKERRDYLIDEATALVKNDISKSNNLLGLGYKSYKQGTAHHNFTWKQKTKYWLCALFGWIITALAISLGAPFWFDLLNKFVKLRGALKSDETDTSPASPIKENT